MTNSGWIKRKKKSFHLAESTTFFYYYYFHPANFFSFLSRQYIPALSVLKSCRVIFLPVRPSVCDMAGRTQQTQIEHLTVKAGHVERLPLDETVALVQLADQQLATAEEVDDVVLVQRNPGGDIARHMRRREMKRQQSINQSSRPKKQHNAKQVKQRSKHQQTTTHPITQQHNYKHGAYSSTYISSRAGRTQTIFGPAVIGKMFRHETKSRQPLNARPAGFHLLILFRPPSPFPHFLSVVQQPAHPVSFQSSV